MADGFDTIPCEPNQSDCQKVSQYTFDTQVGSAYNVSRAIAEQWQVIEELKQDVGELADKTAVKDYNGNIFKNLTLKGENGVNVDINEDNPEQLDVSLDQDITDQIDINTEHISQLTPDVARSLKIPVVTPTETKLVGVDTTNSQEMLSLNYDDFYVDNNVIKLVNNLFLRSYPVGSIYLSIINTSPASFLGGTWEQLPANYALWTASSGAGGTISAGLPNITGELVTPNQFTTYDEPAVSGAITSINGETQQYIEISTSPANRVKGFSFDANKSNSIYRDDINTVQPPAYKIYAWKRTA